MGDGTAGWQTDPTGRFEHRYWDGSTWTDNVSNAGVMSTDPFEPDGETVGAPIDLTTEQPAMSTDPTTQQPVAESEATATWPAAPAAPTPPTYVAPPPPLGAGGGAPSPDARSNRRVLVGAGILAVVAIVVAVLLLGGDSSDTNDITEPARSNATTETTDDILGGGSLPHDFEEQMAQIYEDSLGLPPDKAACLAGKMADAVTSGDLTQEEAMSDVFSYLAECDIDLSEITGN